MTSDPRGLAVIINNEFFSNFKTRNGTECDLKMLCCLFEQLKFKVEKYNGLVAEVSFMHIMYDIGVFCLRKQLLFFGVS